MSATTTPLAPATTALYNDLSKHLATLERITEERRLLLVREVNELERLEKKLQEMPKKIKDCQRRYDRSVANVKKETKAEVDKNRLSRMRKARLVEEKRQEQADLPGQIAEQRSKSLRIERLYEETRAKAEKIREQIGQVSSITCRVI